ncbi:hypothetical protein LCGC14_0171120 [marine sediment metagenome]|uniref:Uncharacterized protein n=1 Tax=marine sediment metagenome TaxID=412755 RepID=A0A0F9V8W5_9ZZZZ
MNSRETWLNELSEEQLLSLKPWDILTTENARKFLIASGRAVLRRHQRMGLSLMSNEEVLHEVYPMLVENLPGILSNCLKHSAEENRDRYIFGCMARLIRCRLTEQVFGSNRPTDFVYMEEIPMLIADEQNTSSLPSSHSLMHPYVQQVNAYLEANSEAPQFLSESEFVPEKNFQARHALIERFRPYLTSREADVLRSMLLSSEDRSLVALDVGTTPKQVSRYRQSIQRKLRSVLVDLGWNDQEISRLIGKKSSKNTTTSAPSDA